MIPRESTNLKISHLFLLRLLSNNRMHILLMRVYVNFGPINVYIYQIWSYLCCLNHILLNFFMIYCHTCQEIWNSPYSNDSFPVYAEDIEAGGDAAPSFAMLSEAARSLQITIVGGSIPERSGGHLYNTCCIFGTDGKLKGKHRKVQL